MSGVTLKDSLCPQVEKEGKGKEKVVMHVCTFEMKEMAEGRNNLTEHDGISVK